MLIFQKTDILMLTKYTRIKQQNILKIFHFCNFRIFIKTSLVFYKTLISQMAGLFEAGVCDVIFSSVVPVVVTSHVDPHVYLFPVVDSIVTLLHFL